ncbi:MAG TPA: TonB-dependent receptor plug domain-containing protein [Polyangiales bacterium]|nr:TonB-dependent receptor plug domain-containing protein [Polyangiales bacterium]
MDAGIQAPIDASWVQPGDAGLVEPREPSAVEVSVRGRSRANAVMHSAYAVSVVDLSQARQQSADLAEVMARSTAVTVQRAGALGSQGSFNLAGLGGQRLRFFLDGVPLDLVGFAAGVQNVPVNLLESVEVYQGVVPARLGSDALGGAVQLTSDEGTRTSGASASYLTGDFGTHRATASVRYVHAPSGLIARGYVFLDRAENDYKVEVPAFDAQGRTRQVRLPRFHDGYDANGFNAAVGVIDKPWAKRLVLSGFRSSYDNEVQNGATMQRPFGAVTFARETFGLHAKYLLVRASKGARLQASAGYARLGSQFRDLSNCLYDWYGRCSPQSLPTLRGEINAGTPQSTNLQTDTFFLRAEHTQRLSDRFLVRVAVAPTYAARTGENPLRGPGYDPLAQARKLFTGVLGVELETALFDERLKNIAFVKGYGIVTKSQAQLGTGEWSDRSRTRFRAGGGDSVRLDLTSELYAKVSYEYALRQPSTDELFGDGMLVVESLSLEPERSHNANLGLTLEDWETVAGSWRGTLNGFARWSNDLIAQIAESSFLRNVNVWEARALGVEGALGWTTPRTRWLSLDARLTYQDLRNRADAGPTAGGQAGDRVPNIPYLSASGFARLHGEAVLLANDAVDLTWNLRYVHAFPLSWESAARRAMERATIPSQVSLGAALTYSLAGRFATTLEAQNLGNAKLFDFYGVQRPGRAFFAKWTLDY